MNPGSMMGCQFDKEAKPIVVESSFVIYDTGSGVAEGHVISGAGRVRRI